VVHLVPFLQAAQDGDGVLDARLTDDDGLEAALERGVLLDVLAVLRERGGADASQLAARQGRLEHVGGVHGAFRAPRSHERMQLVDEQDVASVALLDFPQHRLQPVLELPTVLRSRHEGAQIQRHDFLVLEALRNVTIHDAARQTFDDGGLADPRVADQDRIVLGAPRQDLDHAANLFVPPDDWVELSTAGQVGEVAGILLDRLEGVLRVLRRHPLTASDGAQSLQDLAAGRARFLEERRRRSAPLDEREKKVLDRDEVVVEVSGLRLGLLQKGAQAFVDSGRGAAVGVRAGRQDFSYPSLQPRHIDADSLKEDRRQSALLVQERLEKVLRSDVGMPRGGSRSLGLLQRLLGTDSQLVEVHALPQSP